jgi:hypothetical protein
MKLLFFIASFFVFLSAGTCAQTEILSVCDVLSKIDSYRDKIITVKGLVMGGGNHGHVLKDFEIKNECPQIAKSGRHWPSLVALSFPRTNTPFPDGPLTFLPEYKEIKDFTEKDREIHQDVKLYHLATFVGELRSKKDLNIDIVADDLYVGNGYAEGDQCPAYLVVKSITNVQVVSYTNWKWKDK